MKILWKDDIFDESGGHMTEGRIAFELSKAFKIEFIQGGGDDTYFIILGWNKKEEKK